MRAFSSTPSFKLELTRNKKYNSMDAYKMAFRSAEAALLYPVVPVRLAQLLSDIEESTFLCCFPFSLKTFCAFTSSFLRFSFTFLFSSRITLSSFPPSIVFLLFPSTLTDCPLYFNLWSPGHRRMIEAGLAPQSHIHLGQQPCLPSSTASTTFFPTHLN